MARGGYTGGSTLVHPGSGFFSFKGGPGRSPHKDDGRDKPGAAKAGSKCYFGPIRPPKAKKRRKKKQPKPSSGL